MAPKTLLVTLALASGALSAVAGTFTTYLGGGCRALGSTGGIFEGYCTNIEYFPWSGFEGAVTSGACEDASKTPTIRLYLDPGCKTNLFTSFTIGAQPQCVAKTGSVQSAILVCA
ncbi:hypothetical protein IFM51744_04972 [Aspergillus udagawae]|uniref:Uncharacterized protein n=1 Tax=Aspergillus udagawae TaxID=91492 RepID=A0ABQ1BDM2_9EURO|nr:hypothetical protein IFM51744_04972 [Aspergillus udagawae]GFF99320.1 hypothetical protein IFM53868_10227 [Aspergillus udagawae]GFG12738.1 hypothetical protein IFM5058_06097 [Aspergillus udagawae]